MQTQHAHVPLVAALIRLQEAGSWVGSLGLPDTIAVSRQLLCNRTVSRKSLDCKLHPPDHPLDVYVLASLMCIRAVVAC
jgi:hypothetical protein